MFFSIFHSEGICGKKGVISIYFSYKLDTPKSFIYFFKALCYKRHVKHL